MGLSTNAYLAIGILCLIALALLLRSGLRKPGNGKKPASAKVQSAKAQPVPAKKAAPRQNPYRATSIVAGPHACEAVKSLGEKRFLVAENEVPQLPLPTCNQPRCTCKYAHHADRREAESEDRRGPPGLRSELHAHTGESERRRKRRGRRSSDWE
jgi:hypothetical protein